MSKNYLRYKDILITIKTQKQACGMPIIWYLISFAQNQQTLSDYNLYLLNQEKVFAFSFI